MQYDSFLYEEGPAGYFDYNPVHAIWYLLTQIGLEDRLNESSFLAAAITVYNEGLGISAKLSDHLEVKTTIQQLLGHIAGVLRWGTDTKFHIILIRDDYQVEDLPIVNNNVVLDQPIINRQAWIDTHGEIKIQYNKRVYPPSPIRYVQEAVEVLREGDPVVNIAQEAVEVLHKGNAKLYNIQEAVEVLKVNWYRGIDDIELFVTPSTTTTT